MDKAPISPATGAQKRSRFLTIRCSDQEYRRIQQRAVEARMTTSEYVRRATLSRQVIAKDAHAVASELRRIGALIKHNYPAVLNWSAEEKKRYWQTRERLLALAAQFAQTVGAKEPKGEQK